MELNKSDKEFILEWTEDAYYMRYQNYCVGDIEREECNRDRERALRIVNDLINNVSTNKSTILSEEE
jgi:hypothetical protein